MAFSLVNDSDTEEMEFVVGTRGNDAKPIHIMVYDNMLV